MRVIGAETAVPFAQTGLSREAIKLEIDDVSGMLGEMAFWSPASDMDWNELDSTGMVETFGQHSGRDFRLVRVSLDAAC